MRVRAPPRPLRDLPLPEGRERKMEVHQLRGGDRWPQPSVLGGPWGLRLSGVTGLRHRAAAQDH